MNRRDLLNLGWRSLACGLLAPELILDPFKGRSQVALGPAWDPLTFDLCQIQHELNLFRSEHLDRLYTSYPRPVEFSLGFRTTNVMYPDPVYYARVQLLRTSLANGSPFPDGTHFQKLRECAKK